MSIIPTIYHNPRCSKSREALALLKSKGFKPKVIEYLKNPPTFAELKDIRQMLNVPVRDMLRKKESEYKDFGLDNPKLSDDQILQIAAKHPILLERPIVLVNNQAVIARPVDLIEMMLKSSKQEDL